MFESVAAQSTSASPVPEFTLRYADYSYDVPDKTTTSIDSYTGKTITTTIPGYHVENKTIEATIKNNIGASYYNFRYKGHYAEEWSYYPFIPSSNNYSLPDAFSVPYQASTSSYTVASLPSYFFQSISADGQVDVQVQALFGNFRAVPYGHIMPIPGGPTYDFYFEGTTSDWSNTQTVTVGENSIAATVAPTPIAQTPDPTVTPIVPSKTANSDNIIYEGIHEGLMFTFDWQTIVIATLAVAVVLLAAAVMLQRKHSIRKTKSP